jgi:hypothetical protein
MDLRESHCREELMKIDEKKMAVLLDVMAYIMLEVYRHFG